MWRELIAFLTALAADPAVINAEHPRACAAISVARSSMEKDRAKEEQGAVADPPLVPVEQPQAIGEGRVECKSGECYYIEHRTGRRWRLSR